MKKLFVACLAAVLMSIGAGPLHAEERKSADSIAERVSVIEAEREDLLDRLNKLVEVSGYVDGEFVMSDQAGKNNQFRLHHLSLFFKKQVTEQWRFFSEIEFEDAPFLEASDGVLDGGSDGKLFVEVMTIEYLYNPRLNAAMGRFLTPAGIWSIEHYPPFAATQERPLHIRNIFPQVTDGLQVNGAANLGDTVATYYLYAGNGEGNAGSGDNNEDKSMGARVKFKLPLLTKLELGLSGFSDTNSSDTEKIAYGADISAQWRNIRFQGEYALGDYDSAAGTDYQRSGYYGQFIYGLGNLDLIYRYDWYEPSDEADDDQKTVNTAAINYHFTPSVTGKVEHHFISPEDPSSEDYTKTIFTIAIYLGE